MGFWSALGTLGGAIAAPFTGGLSIPLGMAIGGAAGGVGDAIANRGSGPSTASAVGQTAGSIEQQRMNGLIAQAKLQQEQDALTLYRTNAGVNVGNLNLAQQKQALAAPGELAGQSVRGDVMANGQDASFSGLNPKIHVPTMTGGLRPSMLSASSRALGGQMSRNALADSTSGKYTTQAPLPTIPTATPLPQAGAFDKVLQGTAMGGGFLDALKGIGRGASNIGNVAGDITGGNIPIDPEAGVSPQQSADQFAGMPGASGMPAPPSPENADVGIDPAILEWLKSQADPTLGGSNG